MPIFYPGLDICDEGAGGKLLLLTSTPTDSLGLHLPYGHGHGGGRVWPTVSGLLALQCCPFPCSLGEAPYLFFSGTSFPWRTFLLLHFPFLGISLPPLLPGSMAKAWCLAFQAYVPDFTSCLALCSRYPQNQDHTWALRAP